MLDTATGKFVGRGLCVLLLHHMWVILVFVIPWFAGAGWERGNVSLINDGQEGSTVRRNFSTQQILNFRKTEMKMAADCH